MWDSNPPVWLEKPATSPEVQRAQWFPRLRTGSAVVLSCFLLVSASELGLRSGHEKTRCHSWSHRVIDENAKSKPNVTSDHDARRATARQLTRHAAYSRNSAWPISADGTWAGLKSWLRFQNYCQFSLGWTSVSLPVEGKNETDIIVFELVDEALPDWFAHFAIFLLFADSTSGSGVFWFSAGARLADLPVPHQERISKLDSKDSRPLQHCGFISRQETWDRQLACL